MTLQALSRILGLGALFATSACETLTGPGGGPGPLKALPRELSAAERRVIAGSNQFAFGLLREVDRADTAANVFVSPLSASMALGMTLNGARGPTQDEMRSTLGFGGVSLEEVNASYRGLIDLLRTLDPGVEMRVANSIWARQGYPFEAAFSMTVVLPARGTDLDALVATLTAEQWQEATARFTERAMELSLPRFRLEYEEVLNEPLHALGMRLAFQPGQADFTGLSASGGRGLFISEVKQKTYVDVNEEGTEAAAATSVVIARSGSSSFVVDRPFLVVIRERFSGSILFLGKITAPPRA